MVEEELGEPLRLMYEELAKVGETATEDVEGLKALVDVVFRAQGTRSFDLSGPLAQALSKHPSIIPSLARLGKQGILSYRSAEGDSWEEEGVEQELEADLREEVECADEDGDAMDVDDESAPPRSRHFVKLKAREEGFFRFILYIRTLETDVTSHVGHLSRALRQEPRRAVPRGALPRRPRSPRRARPRHSQIRQVDRHVGPDQAPRGPARQA